MYQMCDYCCIKVTMGGKNHFSNQDLIISTTAPWGSSPSPFKDVLTLKNIKITLPSFKLEFLVVLVVWCKLISCRDDGDGTRWNIDNNKVGYRSVVSQNEIKCVLRHQIYFGPLDHSQKYKLIFALVFGHVLFHFVKPSSETLIF